MGDAVAVAAAGFSGRVLPQFDRLCFEGHYARRAKANQATVVREALLSAGFGRLEMKRTAATVRAADGLPRSLWIESWPDPVVYPQMCCSNLGGCQPSRQFAAVKASMFVSATAGFIAWR